MTNIEGGKIPDLYVGAIVEIIPSLDGQGNELDDFGGCEATILEIDWPEILVTVKARWGEVWFPARRLR